MTALTSRHRQAFLCNESAGREEQRTTIVKVKDSLRPQSFSWAGKRPQIADAGHHTAQLHINHLAHKEPLTNAY